VETPDKEVEIDETEKTTSVLNTKTTLLSEIAAMTKGLTEK